MREGPPPRSSLGWEAPDGPGAGLCGGWGYSPVSLSSAAGDTQFGP